MTARLDYDTATLRAQVLAKHEAKVAAAAAAYAEASDLDAARNEWRATTEAAVLALSDRLQYAKPGEEVPDNVLESFRISSCPRRERYRSTPESDYEEVIEAADRARDRALRRLEAVKADRGTISLTPTMLREVFGL